MAIVAVIFNGAAQVLAAMNPVPSDLFFIGIGASIFLLSLSLALLHPTAHKFMLVDAAFAMAMVGMRFDALSALAVTAFVFVAMSLCAVIAELRADK